MKKVLVIMGATGTGKTRLAMNIADKIDSQIISIDSVMVYKGMNIGSAKPSPLELSIYPHALVDVVLPTETFSVADCVALVPGLIESALAQQKLPILVGGTMMYHYILQNGLHGFPDIPASVREQVQSEFFSKGLKYQWNRLLAFDPGFAANVSENDRQRVHRALELLEVGVVPSEHLGLAKSASALHNYNLIMVCLEHLCRADLYKILDARFDQMLSDGLLEEVSGLISMHPGIEKKPSFRSIGYKHIASYLLGDITKVAAFENAKTATRRFAKRQITWSKKWQNSAFFTECKANTAGLVLKKILE